MIADRILLRCSPLRHRLEGGRSYQLCVAVVHSCMMNRNASQISSTACHYRHDCWTGVTLLLAFYHSSKYSEETMVGKILAFADESWNTVRGFTERHISLLYVYQRFLMYDYAAYPYRSIHFSKCMQGESFHPSQKQVAKLCKIQQACCWSDKAIAKLTYMNHSVRCWSYSVQIGSCRICIACIQNSAVPLRNYCISHAIM